MKKILVIAAHPDDEILGCGATLLYYKKLGYSIKVIFLSDGESSRNLKKNEKKKLIKLRSDQAKKVSKISKFLKPEFINYPDNQLDTIPLLKIVQKIEKEIIRFKPSIIFTHYENDLNVDHQIAFKSVLTATRPKSKSFVRKIYCFEIPSNTDFSFKKNKNKIFVPNFYVNIEKYLKKKLELLRIYSGEMKRWPHQRSIKGIKVISNYRGSQIGVKNAEAFVCIRNLEN